jgi:undecaprenyl diphosphate synthase
LQAIGKLNALPKNVQMILNESIERTSGNTGLTLTLALSYSGRWDIVRAVQMIALDIRRGILSPEDINDEHFSEYLLTKSMPDPDLMIRTSGEMRLSNFLLWESAYSEMYITERLWPDFRRDDLYSALKDYLNRERRFGKTSQQLRESDEKDQQGSIMRIISSFSSR